MINQKPYINIGTEEDMKIKEYAKILKILINKKAKIIYNKIIQMEHQENC